MADHEDAGAMTGHIGTNTPNSYPSLGTTAVWPYSNGAVQIRVGLELADRGRRLLSGIRLSFLTYARWPYTSMMGSHKCQAKCRSREFWEDNSGIPDWSIWGHFPWLAHPPASTSTIFPEHSRPLFLWLFLSIFASFSSPSDVCLSTAVPESWSMLTKRFITYSRGIFMGVGWGLWGGPEINNALFKIRIFLLEAPLPIRSYNYSACMSWSISVPSVMTMISTMIIIVTLCASFCREVEG